MISVIVCSVNDAFASKLERNIRLTIGVEFEFILIRNKIEAKSICHVYNEGASASKHDILCFIHEDVEFQSGEWGKKILEKFNQNADLGLIGVAGAKYKSKTASGWYTGFSELDCCNISHQDSNNNIQKIYFNPKPGSISQDVIVLDGVFLCCTKEVWRKVKFNESLLKDFHLYDVDFSFRASRIYRVQVTYEIEMVHFVKGSHFGTSWVRETLLWHKKFSKLLPMNVPIDMPRTKAIEQIIRKTWLLRLRHESISMKIRIEWLRAIEIWKYFFAWPHALVFLFKPLMKVMSRNGKRYKNVNR